MRQCNGECFDAAFTVTSVRNLEGKACAFRWLLRNFTGRQQAELAPLKNDYDLMLERTVHKYSKGEFIPTNSQTIWYVCRGEVTVTRLMGKLLKQGKICFDSKKHIIIKEVDMF